MATIIPKLFYNFTARKMKFSDQFKIDKYKSKLVCSLLMHPDSLKVKRQRFILIDKAPNVDDCYIPFVNMNYAEIQKTDVIHITFHFCVRFMDLWNIYFDLNELDLKCK